MKRLSVLAMAAAVLLGVLGQAAGDRTNDPTKWSQWVDTSDNGRAIESMWVTTQPDLGPSYVIADDWRCLDGLPVTDVHWWGTYLKGAPTGTLAFEISIHADIPQDACCPSHPGELLHSEIGFVGSTVEEAIFADGPEGDIYQYNYDLEVPFAQVRGEVYWLNIIAIVPSSDDVVWGWNTATHPAPENGIDAAVRIDDYNPFTGEYSEWGPLYDTSECGKVPMAFELTTIPEPGSMALMGTAVLGLVGWVRRKRLS